MRRFLAERVPSPGERVRLDAARSHHLLRVTGIAPGESVELFDGAGAAAEARLIGVEDGRAVLEGAGPLRHDAGRREVVLIVALLKQQALDLVVRMAVELGVTELRPVVAARSVARGDRVERWQRIAEAAATQCGRADLPLVRPPTSLATAMVGLPRGARRVVCVPGAPPVGPVHDSVVALVGPEGGLTDEEVAEARAAGFEAVGLGGKVLRADTAAVAVLARLTP